MTQIKTTQRLLTLSAMICAGILTNTSLASATEEINAPRSRMEMIAKRLMPDDQSFRKGNSALSKRFVMSQDGQSQVNVLVNDKHSLNLSVLFEPNSAALTNQARTLLKDLAQALEADGLNKASYLISGHTDAKGDAKQNRKLSEQRARSVKDYLVNRFDIDPRSLTTAGYGEERLVDKSNPNAKINRRIEVSLISTSYRAPQKRMANVSKPSSTLMETKLVETISARSDYDNEPVTMQYRPQVEEVLEFGPQPQFTPEFEPQIRPMPVGYRINRQFDDYNSSIYTPPTITGTYAYGQTGNAVCDSFEGILTDPRPQHMDLDDYDARTPTTCPAASEYQGTYTAGYKDGFGDYDDEDDNELLK